ncbi:glycosyltransferase [Vibrio anguillarum]|uniref:glycosyltransferase n=1 Tax=Vibrio anguillarum TaxID=55601 RepID=UPI000382730A|nr:glycosyltransferase [Vibrio anguillarum]OEE38965.1 hypothetical protein A1QU_09280 [Vibrio anguillarum]
MKLKKIKLVRVVTDKIVVQWHLNNSLIYTDYNKFDVYVVGDGVSKYSNNYPNVTFVDLSICRKPNPIKDLKLLFQLCSVLKRIRPDIVHSIMPKSGLVASLASFLMRIDQRVHTFTGQVWNLSKYHKINIYYWSDVLIARMNSYCLCDSESQSEYLYLHGIRNDGKKIPFLLSGSLAGIDYNTIDYDSLSLARDKLRVYYNIPKDSFVVLFLARKTWVKGGFDILDSMIELKKRNIDLTLFFVGPDESNDSINCKLNEALSLGIKVISLGKVDNYRHYMSASDLLCLPSRREGFGSVIIEAAAIGVPAVGYSIPGLRDAIDDGVTGYLTPTGDIDTFCDAISKIATNKDIHSQMSANAYTRTKKLFSASSLQRELERKYLEWTLR